MHIGLVYDLRDDYRKLGYSEEAMAEFDSEETIHAIADALEMAGHTIERVGNIWKLVEKLVSGARWDLVFNIAEGMYGIAREAQVPALLDAYRIPYTFSAPDVMMLTLDKALAKLAVQAAGIPTAPFAVIRREEECKAIALPYPLFVKPLAEGTGKGVSDKSLVKNQKELSAACRDLLACFAQPVLVETYLPGREFTVGILGAGEKAEAIGVMEIHLQSTADVCGYTYRNKEKYEKLVSYTLATDAVAQKAQAVAVAAWNALGCRDGGRVDIRCDTAGAPHFLEVNPLAGLHPMRSDLIILASKAGLSYCHLIRRIVEHAAARMDVQTAAVQSCAY